MVAPPATNEQRLRGIDVPFGSALLVTGYDAARVDALLRSELGAARGAAGVSGGSYRLAYSLTARDVAAS
jgi:hypothetical protein